jgi:hypothetical protein
MRPAAAVVLSALALALPALAQGPARVEIVVGERVNVCAARLATCPVLTSLCDDPGVVAYEVGKAGAELKGVKVGSTLCGLLGSSGVRTVVRVTVVPPPPPAKDGGAESAK